MGYRNVIELPVEGERAGRVTLASDDIRLAGVRKLPLPGNRAMVAIRPEEISIAPPGTSENVIAGRVDNVEYGGRDSLFEIVTPRGTRLHVRATGRFDTGANVSVHVPPERALVYPQEAH